MSDEQDQLPPSHAILLMYLADELSPRDREEVEGKLAADEKLRSELESLRQSQGLIWAGLSELDELTRPPVPDGVAIRRASKLVRNWVEELEKIPPPIQMPRRQVPWIRIGAAVAAMILIGYFLWPRTLLHMSGNR